MLYEAAQKALSQLIQESGVQAGAAHVVFDLARCTVTHASFVNDPGLRLGLTEYHVDVDIPVSGSVELAVKAAAINAVTTLNKMTQLSTEERGLPDMKGLMFSDAGGRDDLRMLPYSETVLGFVHKGSVIINPMLSPDRLYQVDPVKAYGFQAIAVPAGSGARLERAHEDGGRLRLSVASNGFIIDRFDENDKRIAYVFSSKLPDSELGAWMDRMPEDFLSHRESWRRGLERLIELEPESGLPDQDEKGFWRHELRAFDFAYGELDALRGVQMQSDSSWEQRLPHDFLSHRASWRRAFERLIELEPEFWRRDLQALDTAYCQLDDVLAEFQVDSPNWSNR